MRRSWKAITIGFVASLFISNTAAASGSAALITPAIVVAQQVLKKSAAQIEYEEERGKTLGQQLLEADAVDAFKDALLQQAVDDLAGMVAQGQIDQAKADEMLAGLAEHIRSWDGRDERSYTQSAPIGGNLHTAADVLGMTQQELVAALETQNLGQLLLNAGRLEEYKAQTIADLQRRMAESVQNGMLAPDKAAALVETMAPSIEAWDGTAS